MTSKRNTIIVEHINKLKNNSHLKVTLVNGKFGSGKSEFVDELKNVIKNENIADAIIHFNVGANKQYLVDYVLDNNIEFVNDDSAIIMHEFSESIYNKTRFYELLNDLNNKTPDLFASLHKCQLMRRFPDYEIPDKTDIEKLIEKNSDRRLLTKTERIVSESLIVDLLNLICPLSEDYLTYDSIKKKIKNPFRILLIFDNLDSHFFSIMSWLNNELLNLSLNCKLSDFIGFKYDDLDSDIKISELIDFSFIISSRIDPFGIDDLSWINQNKQLINQIYLGMFDERETEEYLSAKGINNKELSGKIHDYSYGLPFLIDLIADNRDNEINEISRDNSYQLFASKFFDTDDLLFSEALKFCVVVNPCDKTCLDCNNKIQDDSERILKKLIYSNDTFDYIDNRLFMYEPIRTILLKSMERNNKLQVLDYRYIKKTTDSIKDKFKNLSSDELKIFRNLAYFKNFDLRNAIDKAFDDKSDTARYFIENHRNLFVRRKHTYAVEEIHIPLLTEYNRISDGDKFELKKQLIGKIWDDFSTELQEEKNNLTASINTLELELQNIMDNPTKNKQDYDSNQRAFIENENELIKLKKSLAEFSVSKYISPLFVNLIAGIISFVIAYLFPLIFVTTDNHTSIVIIQYILFFISLIFTLVAFSYIFKMVKLSSNKKGRKIITDKIKQIEIEKEERQVQMNQLRDLSMNGQKQSKLISERIFIEKKRLSQINELLDEPFI